MDGIYNQDFIAIINIKRYYTSHVLTLILPLMLIKVSHATKHSSNRATRKTHTRTLPFL